MTLYFKLFSLDSLSILQLNFSCAYPDYASGLVEVYKFERFSKRASGGWGFSNYFDNHEQHLASFLHKAFSELLLYRFCFWDYEHLYIVGEKGDRDFVGIALHSQFTYNP